MTPDKVTLKELVTAVRELTFDRFIIPAFAVKQKGKDCFISVDKEFVNDASDENAAKGRLLIYSSETDEENSEKLIEKTIVEIPFSKYKTLEEIMDALISKGIVVAYTPYFRGAEPSNSLIQVTGTELTDDFTAFRRYFFSDEEITEFIYWYYSKVLDIHDVELTDEIIGKLVRPSERHLAIWVSYHLVEKRRLYENAANAIGQSFTDGSDYTGSSDTSAGTSTTVQIGSVFSITEDPSRGYFYEDYNRVGSDNTWGDRYSFWYKLMLYLRDLLETQFGDYSLRKDQVIPGQVTLNRELDFRSYYDSYPFTLSPLTRGVLSKTP